LAHALLTSRGTEREYRTNCAEAGAEIPRKSGLQFVRG
jgi:hypothetical protein